MWRFEAALAEAQSADDDTATSLRRSRRRSVTAVTLLMGLGMSAEPAREDLRRRAIDALARLAELHEKAGDPEAALSVLDQAVRHDSYAEALYQRIMRLQATLGRPHAVRRAYRLLETRLTNLNIDHDDSTQQLLQQQLSRTVDAGSRR
ncbi:MAG: AfsR/SARP family transcriptional regulator [Egibacteraceae bacterium]